MAYSRKFNRVLVIGGSGFLGRHLIESLLDRRMRVCSLDIVKPSWLDSSVEFFEGSFSTTSTLIPALQGCDAVFHLASTTLPKSSNEDPLFDISTNLLSTVELLERAVKMKVKRFVFISSGGTVYGMPSSVPVSEPHATNPTCSYGIVKLSLEKYMRLYHRLHGIRTISLRLSNPYGEYQRVDKAQGAVAVFCDRALKHQPIEIWGDGTVIRDFIYVKDAVDAMLKAMDSDRAGMEINVGYGSGVSLNQVLDQIEAILGYKTHRNYTLGRTFDVPRIYLDITRAKQMLSWTPKVPLSTGIERLLRKMELTSTFFSNN